MVRHAILVVAIASFAPDALAQCRRDAAAIIELDRQYQDAVLRNDADAMTGFLPRINLMNADTLRQSRSRVRSRTVIPAQAGIHFDFAFSVLKNKNRIKWIPACAGMTACRNFVARQVLHFKQGLLHPR